MKLFLQMARLHEVSALWALNVQSRIFSRFLVQNDAGPSRTAHVRPLERRYISELGERELEKNIL
ncbi:hypothetical protein FF124_18965 [Martelella lutilitoris]|uniref:Uncharacterized protein n=1 Tax=Martelella lutilitoris TaxID=2583532 RepID=A0A5C4JM92_9HYPH|nr:hypothetical protein [Martelella lutilitoris]TNB46234.1 hypothetical protein FF124_18965 [Martelella lutilitoris]